MRREIFLPCKSSRMVNEVRWACKEKEKEGREKLLEALQKWRCKNAPPTLQKTAAD